MSETFERVLALVALGSVRVSEHGLQALEDDDILPDEVFDTVGSGVIVEDYPDAFKGPSVLMRQTLADGRHIHAVWGIPKANHRLTVLITAYVPDPARWSADFLSRLP